MDFKNLELSDDQITEIKKHIEATYVSKDKYDEILLAKGNLETSIKERDRQLKELNKSTVNESELKALIEKYQKNNETLTQQLKQNEINYAVERTLTKAGAKNLKAVKALLDLTNTEINNGEIKDLEKQIEQLKKADDSSFLFESKTVETPKFVGVAPSEGSGRPVTAKAENMTYEQLCQYLENNPTV